MPCPHCAVAIHPDWETGLIHDYPEAEAQWRWESMQCPSCHNVIIRVSLRYYTGGEYWGDDGWESTKRISVEPSSAKRRPIGEGVPTAFIEDYEEACAVLPVSAKASAALSRRVLQSILRHQGYDDWSLADQIDNLLAETQADKVLPSGVKENVDVIRKFGNFSAHPVTDKNTLQVIPVAPEEAEWCLEIIETLFDHYYVIPAANKKRRDELNQRLQQAGQKPTKS